MKRRSKLLVYISGPSCAGKSTISNELLRREPSIQYILGDDFWIRNEQYDFNERVEKTNQDIIASLEDITSRKILLEWVPSLGPFVESIRNVGEAKGYELVHIVITAPIDVLKRRKLNRDGNMDLGPVELEKYMELKNVILFDSSVDSVDLIVKECLSILE